MVNLNGNVPTINLGLSVGLMAMMAFGIVIGGIYIDDTHKSAQQAKDNAAELKKKVDVFIDNWEKRVQISNKINNESKDIQVALLENVTEVLKIQLENERQLKQISNEIIHNLTTHRLVSNETRDKIINLTGQVDIGIQQNTKILNALAKAQNVTVTEEQVKDNKKDIQQLRDLLNNLLNSTNDNELNATGTVSGLGKPIIIK